MEDFARNVLNNYYLKAIIACYVVNLLLIHYLFKELKIEKVQLKLLEYIKEDRSRNEKINYEFNILYNAMNLKFFKFQNFNIIKAKNKIFFFLIEK